MNAITSLFTVTVLAWVSLVGCSKANNVDQSTQVMGGGAQCSGTDDQGCGVGSVCVLGQCRHGCTNDAECPQGSICVGDRPPYGCTTPDEGACADGADCPSGLMCGLDHVCRHACTVIEDCPRNEHECIGKSCVSKSERNFESWLCDPTANFEPERSGRSIRYSDEGATYACNVEAPGNQLIDVCYTTPIEGGLKQVSPFALVFTARTVSAGTFGALFDRVSRACPASSCTSGAYHCPAKVDCGSDTVCSACVSEPYSEPFECRPSKSTQLEHCTCLPPGQALSCPSLPTSPRITAPIYLVPRTPVNCTLKLPDAYRIKSNGYVAPLDTSQALVVSEERPLVAGSDYELVDGVITLSPAACALTNVSTYVCAGTCHKPIAGLDDPEACRDIQEY